LTFAELDARAENIAAALASFLTGPDQVVAVAISQDNWQIVASHLGILKAGGTLMFLDTTLPDALITHMLNDAQPVVVLTRGQDKFRDLPTLNVEFPRWMPAETADGWTIGTAPGNNFLHQRHIECPGVEFYAGCEPGP
jgi:non-ribosomal peptide synthetase component F